MDSARREANVTAAGVALVLVVSKAEAGNEETEKEGKGVSYLGAEERAAGRCRNRRGDSFPEKP